MPPLLTEDFTQRPSGGGRDSARELLSPHTLRLTHLHIPVCTLTHTLSSKDIPRQGMFAHSYIRLLKQLCGCTVLCVTEHILIRIL